MDGSKIGCFGLTEPGAGSDVAAGRTTAVKDGDEYVINGEKIFTTNSGFADTFLVFAVTDKSVPAAKGMSAFLVDRNTPGITVTPDIPRMGIRAASNAAVVYEDVRVPACDLLGQNAGHTAVQCRSGLVDRHDHAEGRLAHWAPPFSVTSRTMRTNSS